MSLENYEGTALETFTQENNDVVVEQMQGTEPQENSGEQIDVTETIDSHEGETVTENETDDGMFNIPGIGIVSAEDIKEWKQGNLRQNDYTRKTQELARQREQLKDAENLFSYLQSNPHLIEAIKQAESNPSSVTNNVTRESQMIKDLAYKQKEMEIELKLKDLKEKYGNDVDEIALFNKAAELQTDDLEFVYRGLKNSENVNIDEIKEALKKEIKAELEANKNSVSTTVTTKQGKVDKQISLTAEQKRVANAMGLSESEYAKWM